MNLGDTSYEISIAKARSEAVDKYSEFINDPDGVYSQVAALAAKLFGTPMAKLTLVDRDYTLLLASHGFDAGDGRINRGDSLCELVVAGEVGHLVDDTLTNPVAADRAFLRRHNVRFYACAPIIDNAGFRLGTVTVMDTKPRSASDKQLAMLEDLAAVAAKQLELARTSRDSLITERRSRDAADSAREQAESDRDEAQVDRDAAVRERESAELDRDLVEAYAATLQRTLVPPLLPNIRGAALAKYYLPASPRQVGGDFYDVFPINHDDWGFFIGDVVGHGVAAAVATSLIRYTLRSAALHYDDPVRGLRELNAVMLGELRPRRACTVLTGMMRPHPDGDGFYITLATGGHQPALLLDPAEKVALEVRPGSGLMVGAMRDATFGACSLRLKPGQSLFLFTDGLVEARRGAAPFEIEHLAAFAAQRAHLTVDELASDIATLTAKLSPADDVAVLIIKALAADDPLSQ